MNATLARLTRLAVDLSHESDARLLDGFLAGSQPAFRELVYRHGPLVFGVCQRILRHRQDAEDAFQAVFLVLARRAADVWPRDAVGSWLHGVASRVALKARTTRAKRTARVKPLEDVPQPGAARPEPDTAEVVDRVVRKLPEVYRAAVIACDLEGLSRKDAAGQLGWSEGTLSGRLARARKLLADRLRKAGVTLPAGGLAIALGTTAPVRAGLEERVMELITGNATIGVSAPVAALAEGVVSSMYMLKLKTFAAVMLVTGAIGYGAWAAGSGDGPGGGAEKQPVLALTAAQSQPKQTQKPQQVEDPALKHLQGRWRMKTFTQLGTGKLEPPVGTTIEFKVDGSLLTVKHEDANRKAWQEEYRIRVDARRTPHTIDLISPGPVSKGIYMLTARAQVCAGCHTSGGFTDPTDPREMLPICTPGEKSATGLRLAVASMGTRPAKFGEQGIIEGHFERVGDKAPDTTEPDAEYERLKRELDELRADDKNKDQAERVRAKERVLAAKLEEITAQTELVRARAQLDQAQATAAIAQVQLHKATENLRAAQARLAAAEKAAKADAPVPQTKDSDVFSVHVRPLAAAEKVIRVKASNQSVLEGLAHAAEDMALKADALTIWVARGKEILPVDLVALHKGDTATNYLLKPGDRLFVQAKLTK